MPTGADMAAPGRHNYWMRDIAVIEIFFVDVKLKLTWTKNTKVKLERE